MLFGTGGSPLVTPTLWGLDAEALAILATAIITAAGGAYAAIAGARREMRAKRDRGDEPLTAETLAHEMTDAKGEVRTHRQETRLEHKETRKLIEDEARETRDAIAGLRDVLIEVRALLRSR